MGRSRTKRADKTVTLSSGVYWDTGASGPANQERLRSEPVTDFDPETGKETANPNGIMRRRRENWVARYYRKGEITREQAAAAERLVNSYNGIIERDPLAAIMVDQPRGDPVAAKIDARRLYHALWKLIPAHCKPVVQRVVIDDLAIWPHASGPRRKVHLARLQEGLEALR